MNFGYAINQWKSGMAAFVRPEEHERAFKTIAATGFEEVELRAGTFRWEPLGRPERIAQYYGSVDAFLEVLRACGLRGVSSIFFDPGELILEEPSFGRDPLSPGDRDGIVASVAPFAELLHRAGGSTLVVRPVASHWRTGTLDETHLDELASTWNAVAAATASLGIRVALHIDCLSALQEPEEIAALLERCDEGVGLALDTAELTIMGIDPVELYERHADRVVHLHLKDVRVTDELGERTKSNAELEFLSAAASGASSAGSGSSASTGASSTFPRSLPRSTATASPPQPSSRATRAPTPRAARCSTAGTCNVTADCARRVVRHSARA